METKIIKLDKEKPLEYEAAINEAVALLKKGEIVAFPTETVYGLGADGLREEAAKKIYAAKGRPSDNPLILHIDSLKMMAQIADSLPHMAMEIMAAFCPGPVTIIVKKKDSVPLSVTGGLDTVGVRWPGNEAARRLIGAVGSPLAAPSANISGSPSPTTAQAVYDDLKGRVPLILDDGACSVGVESTIVDCTGEVPVILRPGAITLEMLKELFPVVRLDAALHDPNAIPKAPGLKYRHYAPKMPVYLFKGDLRKTAGKMAQELDKLEAEGKTVGVIASEETMACLSPSAPYVYGKRGELDKIASNIFAALRYFDRKNVDAILVEGTGEDELGLAVMNRLQKAAGGNVIEV